MNHKILLIILIGLIASANSWKLTRKLNFKNKCSQTVWVGGFAIPQPVSTGFQLTPGATYVLPVAANTVAGRFWARTDCKYVDNKFVCATGDCGTPSNNFGVQCKGITGKAPATLVQFTFSSTGGSDFYDLSNVDGHNIPVYFGPTPGTFTYVNNPDLGKYNCGTPSCTLNTNLCPRQLQFKGESGTTYCYSICAAVYDQQQINNNYDILGPIAKDDLKKDLVCCACGPGNGGCTDPASHFCCSPLDPRQNIGGKCYVENWPKPSSNFARYDLVFKNQCPDAYSWQFDDGQSTYQCVDGDYDITFCPNN